MAVLGFSGAVAASLDGNATLLAELDERRRELGLEPLNADPALTRAAAAMVAEVAAAARRLPSRRPAQIAGLSAEDVDLDRHLAAAGYEAESARAVLVVAAGEAADAIATTSRGEEPLAMALAIAELTDVGVGRARFEEVELLTLIFGRAAATAFAERTAPLEDLVALRDELLERVNQARREHDVAALAADECLEGVAQAYADEMLAGGFFDHVSPRGEGVLDRLLAARCKVRRSGENLASGPPSAAAVVTGWLGSPRHRDILLGAGFTRTGFGVAFGAGPAGRQILWVQVVSG